jgi:hypothetical protein
VPFFKHSKALSGLERAIACSFVGEMHALTLLARLTSVNVFELTDGSFSMLCFHAKA